MGLLELLASGLLLDTGQYRGDANLMKARGLLTAEERPKVPVDVEDPGYVLGMSDVRSPSLGTLLPIRLRAEAKAVTPLDKSRIVMNRKQYMKKGIKGLAGTLAHEAVHSGGEENETVAYEKQMEVLRRLGAADPELVKHLKRQMALYGTK